MFRIGLIDVDGHAKKKKWGATVYPNLALMKIAAWHKQRGDSVEWYNPLTTEKYTIVYMSKIFNFSPDYDYVIKAWNIIKGGTGYITSHDQESVSIKDGQRVVVIAELDEEIDRMQPDYSIYPLLPKDIAYGFLTRGCPNKCRWCVVPRKEGAIRPYMDVDEIATPERRKLILMDNNILAAGDYATNQLEKIIERDYRVDFNQAIDARLVNDDNAKLLAKVHWLYRRIRFGCDTRRQIDECQRAINLIRSYGYKGEFFIYTMLTDDFKESYSRVHYWWEMNQRARESHSGERIYAYAQPFRDPNNPHRTVPDWQQDLAGWVNKKMLFETCTFGDYQPRKNFFCQEYIDRLNK